MPRQRTILLLILLGFAVLTGYLLVTNHVVSMPHDESPDPLQYMKGARDLWHYDSDIHPPLYSAAIATLMLVVRDPFVAAKAVSLLAGLGVLLLVFGLGRRCFSSDRSGLLAAALTAMSPLFVNAAYSPGSDMLSTLLFLGSIYLLSVPSPVNWKVLAAGGAVAGMVYLTRYLFVGMIPAALLYFGLVLPGSLTERLKRCLAWSGAFALVAAPWSLICLGRYGNLHDDNYVAVASSILQSANDNMTNWDVASHFPNLMSVIEAYPGALMKMIAKNILYLPSKIVVPEATVAGIASIIGLPLAFVRSSPSRLLLNLNFAAIVGLIMLTWLKPRFFVPVLPLIILAGAYILSEHLPVNLEQFWPEGTTFSGWIRRLPARRIGILLALTGAMLIAVVQIPEDAAERNIDDMKRAGLAIKASASGSESVLTTSKTLAWYAQLPYINIKEIAGATDSTLDQKMRNAGARVMVYSARHAVWDFPQ